MMWGKPVKGKIILVFRVAVSRRVGTGDASWFRHAIARRHARASSPRTNPAWFPPTRPAAAGALPLAMRNALESIGCRLV
jgi:hypothetical protein